MTPFLDGVINGILDEQTALYNPVVFYGEPSVTAEIATHLHREYHLRYPKRRIVHTCGKEFLQAWILSLVDGTQIDFSKPFYSADLLVFEDINEIAGKDSAMREFYSVFDHVLESGGQIVVTASCPPHQIPLLDDRIRTQLVGGMICFVG